MLKTCRAKFESLLLTMNVRFSADKHHHGNTCCIFSNDYQQNLFGILKDAHRCMLGALCRTELCFLAICCAAGFFPDCCLTFFTSMSSIHPLLPKWSCLLCTRNNAIPKRCQKNWNLPYLLHCGAGWSIPHLANSHYIMYQCGCSHMTIQSKPLGHMLQGYPINH